MTSFFIFMYSAFGTNKAYDDHLELAYLCEAEDLLFPHGLAATEDLHAEAGRVFVALLLQEERQVLSADLLNAPHIAVSMWLRMTYLGEVWLWPGLAKRRSIRVLTGHPVSTG